MGFGHVLFDGGMTPLLVASDMAGDSCVVIEALDGSAGDADIDLLFDQPVRDAVKMSIHFNVIIDVYPGLFPFCELITSLRQSLQLWLING